MKKHNKFSLKKFQPFIILLSIAVVIWLLGFAAGCVVSAPASSDNVVEAASVEIANAEWVDFKATAYCSCRKCCGKWANNRPIDNNGKQIVTTASGERAVEGVTIAADWSVLPKGTQVEIQGMGTYTVQDKGGKIKGNRIDIFFENHSTALQFGVQNVKVRVVK